MNYFLHLLVMIGIYLPLVYSLNILVGFGGLVSFCHAAFYGVGAYGYAILITKAGFSPPLALALAVAITSLLAAAIGVVSLRFRGNLFLFTTLCFQMIIFAILYNWVELTNGPNGISIIQGSNVNGITLHSPFKYLILVCIMNLLLLPPIFYLYRSPFATILKALRENKTAAESLGIHSKRIYLQSFVLSAALAAFPGAFFASYVIHIDPTSFSIKESVFILAIILLGGSGNIKGPFVGVVIMLLLPEVLGFIGLPDNIAYNIREIFYGLLLALLMYFRPQKLAGEFKVANNE